jgi:hypothetical protein
MRCKNGFLCFVGNFVSDAVARDNCDLLHSMIAEMGVKW